MCPADCGPAGQYIGSKPPIKKIHWPRRGRRPRINKPLHRRGLPICRPSGAFPARMCPADCGPAGQYIGSKPPPKKTHWPCRGRRPRINKPMHRCGLPICRPYGALKTLARRCLATDMSPLRVGAARMCRADCGPAGQYIGSKPAVKKTRWPRRGRRPRVTGLMRHVCAQRIVAQRANILVASPRQKNTLAL
jgi:hypothetical protein